MINAREIAKGRYNACRHGKLTSEVIAERIPQDHNGFSNTNGRGEGEGRKNYNRVQLEQSHVPRGVSNHNLSSYPRPLIKHDVYGRVVLHHVLIGENVSFSAVHDKARSRS